MQNASGRPSETRQLLAEVGRGTSWEPDERAAPASRAKPRERRPPLARGVSMGAAMVAREMDGAGGDDARRDAARPWSGARSGDVRVEEHAPRFDPRFNVCQRICLLYTSPSPRDRG